MQSFIQKLAGAFSVIALAAALVSCGGGGGASTDSSQAQGKGTVGILLTDKPADPALFAAIIASITRVELMGSEENGPITLYEGPPTKEFDLLRLRNESIPLAFKDGVPAGTYCKIRLILSELELVLTNGTPNDPIDDTSEYPKLPGNGKLDLVARDCFNVVDGEVLTLQLDIDAGKSIHVIEKGNCSSNPNKSCFNFRPVIFVDVIDKDFDSKLVRLNGEITKVYSDGLLLCRAIPLEGMDNQGCVQVNFGEDSFYFPNSAFFDSNTPWDGAPRAISDLLRKANVGKELTVVGRASSWAKADNDDDKPDEYYPLLQLDALVAELGEFLQVGGEVAEIPDDTGLFAMTVSSGPVKIDSTETLDVMLQPGDSDINGTRIVSKSGALLEPANIEKFLPVQVDGVLQVIQDSDLLLKAALVIIDKAAQGTEQVTGVIGSVETDKLYLVPDEDVGMVCGMDTNLLEVALASDLDILTITIFSDSSEIEAGGTLLEGQTVGMNGKCEGTDYQTDNVVIVDDRR